MREEQGTPRLGQRKLAAVVMAAVSLLGLVSAVERVRSQEPTQRPTVLVEPETSEVRAGERFTVSVSIRDVVDLMAFQITLDHDADTLRFLAMEIGPFLASTGRNVRPVGIVTATGTVSFGATSFPGAPGPSGGGVLATVGYQALSPGESPIAIRRALLSDTSNTPITDTIRVNGLVIVSPAVSAWQVHLPLASLP